MLLGANYKLKQIAWGQVDSKKSNSSQCWTARSHLPDEGLNMYYRNQTIILPHIIEWIYVKYLNAIFTCNVERKAGVGGEHQISLSFRPLIQNTFNSNRGGNPHSLLFPVLLCSASNSCICLTKLQRTKWSNVRPVQLLSAVWQISLKSFICGERIIQLLLLFRYESSLPEAQQMDLDFSKPLFTTAALFTACK